MEGGAGDFSGAPAQARLVLRECDDTTGPRREPRWGYCYDRGDQCDRKRDAHIQQLEARVRQLEEQVRALSGGLGV